MNSIIFDLGIIKIKWYSLFILLAIFVAYIVIFRESKKKKVPEIILNDLIFYEIIIGIIGARLYYVIFNLDYYLKNKNEILMIWNGGLAIHGGILAAILFLIIYSRKKGIKILMMMDILAVGLIIGQSIGRWGNFFNQEAYGRIVSLTYLKKLHLPPFIIKGMYIDNAYREPTFLYESLFSLLGFIILIIVRKKNKLRTGQLTGLYFCWYGLERLIIESFRSDSLMLGTIKVAQLISIFAIFIGIYLIFKKKSKTNLYKEDNIIL